MTWPVVVGLGWHGSVTVASNPVLQSSCNFRGQRPPGFRNREMERQLPGAGAPGQTLLAAYPYPFSSSSFEAEPRFGREKTYA